MQKNRAEVRHKKGAKFTFDHIIGESEAIKSVIAIAKAAARTSSSVLIVGDTGTGKELFAQSIHNRSDRSQQPFISQNCATIPGNLMEGILFGTRRGAFTGALDRPGLFEEANGGTLLLDEINSLDPLLQAKLLRVIQEKTIRRVGGLTDRKIDVRIITTINEDPIMAIHQNRLRADLYYRLCTVPLFIPRLIDRGQDMLILLKHFIEKYNALFNMNVKTISRKAKEALLQHDWPGNVRELEHMVEGAMNMAVGREMIRLNDFPMGFQTNNMESNSGSKRMTTHEGAMTLRELMEKNEKRFVRQTLQNNGNNISRSAKILGISRQSLQYRIRKFGL